MSFVAKKILADFENGKVGLSFQKEACRSKRIDLVLICFLYQVVEEGII